MARNRHRTPSPWPDLQPELLQKIIELLKPTSQHEVMNLRSVCRNWRSSIPPPFLHHCPALPYRTSVKDNDNFTLTCSFTATAVYLLRQGSRSWLVEVEETCPGKLRLLDPLTLLPFKPETLPEKLPIGRVNVVSLEINRGFTLRFSNGQTAAMHKNWHKVVVWSNPRIECPELKDYSYVALARPVNPPGILSCHLLTDGVHSGRETGIGYKVSRFDDIVNWKGMVFAVDHFGRLYGIDYDTREVMAVLAAIPVCDEKKGKARKQLVVDLEDECLYMVNKRLGVYYVYRYDERLYRWEKLESLGDRVLFLRPDTCFFVPTKEIPGCEHNLIVVAASCAVGLGGEARVFNYGKPKVGVMNKSRKISSCENLCEALGPPPQWIWEHK